MTPMGNNDYLTASAFLQEPLRLTPSTTWGDKFLVPADAEVIIRKIPPGVRDKQNPFGEIWVTIKWRWRCRSSRSPLSPTGETALSKTSGRATWTTGTSEASPRKAAFTTSSRKIFQASKRSTSSFRRGTLHRLHLDQKEFENEPNKAGMQAFVEMPNLKLAVIVDDDVDVFNEREVMWAVATRVHWDKDIEIIREVQSFRGWLGDSVAIIDATVPLKGGWPKRNEIQPEAFERVAKFFK